MKICPKCNTGNKDTSFKCSDCGFSIGSVQTKDKSQIRDDYVKKEETKLLMKKIISIASIILIGLFYLFFIIKASSKDNFLQTITISILLTTVGYLNIFYPKFLFILKNVFAIQNIDEIEVTDFYKVMSMITGIILIGLGIVNMFIFNM